MELNLPPYPHKVQLVDGNPMIYDSIRKKYVALTPEEWVRQHFINYLIVEKQYRPALIAVEKTIRFNDMNRRFDIVCYYRDGTPCLIVECKAPDIPLSDDVFNQVLQYNYTIAAPYIIITNGITHLCAQWEGGIQCSLLSEIPSFPPPKP